jgi:acyl transferase domain-containing protein/SAM-dependent methyltransferase
VIFEPWDDNTLRRISISSFGYGGTNGHIILDSLSTYIKGSRNSGSDEELKKINIYRSAKDANNTTHPQVLTISAKSKDSLVKYLEHIQQWLSENSLRNNDTLQNLAHTLSTRRSVFRWRCGLVGTSLPEVLSRLEGTHPTPVKSTDKGQIVFLFTGQGAQWHAMGRELMSIDSAYSKSLEASEIILRELGASWNLIEELSYQDPTESRVNQSQIAQPATTALQIALIDILSSINVKPDIVLGHSSGEIAAAYAAGSLSQASALKVAYYRGRLQVCPSLKGAMMAVALGEESVTRYISRVRCGKLVVACSNSPDSSTVSGDEAAIHELKEILSEDSIFTRVLAVDTAYHSHHLISASETYLHDLNGLEHKNTSSGVVFISSVTGEEKVAGFGGKYWVKNLVSQVRFQNGLEQVCRKVSSLSPQAKLSFIELGPHNALSGPLRQTMSSLPPPTRYFSASILLRKQDACYTLLDTAGKLFEQGSPVDIEKLNLLFKPNEPRKTLMTLPTYAWDHSDVHWHESRLSRAHRFRKNPHHDLLGSRIASSTTQNPVWRHMLGVDQLPWLREHVIDGFTIFPASGYVSMAIEALLQSSHERYGSFDISSYNLKNVKFIAPLLIPQSPQTIEIQLALTTAENSHDSRWNEFKVFSVSAQGSSVELCHGYIMARASTESDEVEAAREQEANKSMEAERLYQFESSCDEKIDRENFYNEMERSGNKYTGNFACIKSISVGGTKAISAARIPDTALCMPAQFQQPHIIHPATLDAMMHHPLAIISRHNKEGSLMVVGVDDLEVSSQISSKSGTPLKVATSTLGCGSRFPSADISVFQQNSDIHMEPVIKIKNLKFRATGYSEDSVPQEDRKISYNMEWDLDADHMTSSMFNLGPNSRAAERAQEEKLYVLNQAAAIYARNCIRHLTVDGAPKLSGHFPHLFDWMNRFTQSEHSNRLLQGVSEMNGKSILERAQKLGVEGELCARLGPNMEAILTGKADAISLMTEDNLLYRIYSDDSSARIYDHVIRYMKKVAFKNSNIRVLELGGGTAATTAPLLEALGPEGILPFEKYVFTDVSSGFFERTRERLNKWDNFMEYKKLDMNSDFLEQGFENETYDLIIGANCIHIASSVGSVISNIRKLLKPGGRLVMIETIRVVPFYTTFMGVFDGWWAGNELNHIIPGALS